MALGSIRSLTAVLAPTNKRRSHYVEAKSERQQCHEENSLSLQQQEDRVRRVEFQSTDSHIFKLHGDSDEPTNGLNYRIHFE